MFQISSLFQFTAGLLAKRQEEKEGPPAHPPALAWTRQGQEGQGQGRQGQGGQVSSLLAEHFKCETRQLSSS